MANAEHLSILKSGVEAWNRWRYRSDRTIPDLYDADLRHYDLRGANLRRAGLSKTSLTLCNLEGADLREADLYEADLFRTNLQRARLDGAYLCRANFYRADLSRACLYQALLGRADLTQANLHRANLTRSSLSEANLTRADCTDADFRDSFLKAVRVHGTHFDHADLTGACIQDWHTNARTRLDAVTCKYFFGEYDMWKHQFFQRHPADPDDFLAPGQFADYLTPLSQNLELAFLEPIDWQAVLGALEHLKTSAAGIVPQALEQRGQRVLILRLTLPRGVEPSAVEPEFWAEYHRRRPASRNGRSSQEAPDLWQVLEQLAATMPKVVEE